MTELHDPQVHIARGQIRFWQVAISWLSIPGSGRREVTTCGHLHLTKAMAERCAAIWKRKIERGTGR